MAGRYQEDVFRLVDATNQANYESFSKLLRMTFDEALDLFQDASIELLHIDGLHTYEAVRHDFDSWRPKLAPGAVVLFHDTQVHEHDFGVWRLWAELQERYPRNLEFSHSHGLGVLQLNDAHPGQQLMWLQPHASERTDLLRLFAALGAVQRDRLDLMEATRRVVAAKAELTDRDRFISGLNETISECDRHITGLNQTISECDQHINRLNQTISECDRQITWLNQTLSDRDRRILGLTNALAERDLQVADLTLTVAKIHQSTVWRVSAPLRWYGERRARLGRLLRTPTGWQPQPGSNFPEAPRESGDEQGCESGRGEASSSESASAAPQCPQCVDSDVEEPPLLSGHECVAEPRTAEILFVSHDASRTGAPMFLLALARSLSQQLGVSCAFLLRRSGALESEFRALGPTWVLGNPDDLDPETLATLRDRDIRLVYSNTITNGFVQRRLKELGCPILCHIHELGYSIKRHFDGINFQAIAETTDYFLAGSGAVARYLVGKRGIDPDRIAVAYPFVDARANCAIVALEAQPLDLPSDATIIGACGTIDWRKGPDLWVQVAHRVIQHAQRQVHFVWVGGPLTHEDFARLRYDAEVMGIADHMTFPGATSSHLPYLSQFDIFVLPSREDPFPLVALDAATLGLPLVCFDNGGGAPEFVETDTGFVVPYLDVDGMAQAILELVGDEALRQRFGAAAQAKVLERHDISVGGPQIANIVRRYIGTLEKLTL